LNFKEMKNLGVFGIENMKETLPSNLIRKLNLNRKPKVLGGHKSAAKAPYT